jgi:phosphohistidine phosphatase SixA
MNLTVSRRGWCVGLAAGLGASWYAMVSGVALADNTAVLAWGGREGLGLLAREWRREGGVPPEFVLGQCRTQRNLSEEGRQASRQLGLSFRQLGIQPDAVRSSQWCRCQDTARLAFGQFEDWPALNSTFAGQGDAAAQQVALRQRLQHLSMGRMEVWVTHQVNMTALTGAYPAMGEGFLVNRQARLLARGGLAV